MDLPTTSTFKPSVWLSAHPTLQIALIDHLFARLDGIYPTRWRSSFPCEVSVENWRATWSEAFDEDGITPQMVAEGLRQCRRRGSDWPPSLPEFMKLCNASPDVDAALNEAVTQMVRRKRDADTWSDPRIYWAAVEIGEFDLLSKSFDWLRPRFERALRKVIEAGNVQPVPSRALALPAPGKPETDCETGKRKVAELLAGMKSTAKPGLAWAERAIERERQGRPVPPLLLKQAREALGGRAGRGEADE